MTRRHANRLNLRNGLAWRDGRPRWEPSPASRKVGCRGLDLKRADGAWMDRGEAIGAADARALWAGAIRAAAGGGAKGAAAAEALAATLDRLEQPADAAARAKREMVADLIAVAKTLLGEISPAMARPPARRERTVARMVEAYFASEDVSIAESTRRTYRGQSKTLLAEMGEQRVADVTRGQLMAWYRKMRAGGRSIASSNLVMGTASAFFAWAANCDPQWIATSPAVKLNLEEAPGRLVFWTMEEEQTFTAWCDVNGYEDVADGIIGALWMGPRIGDLCKAKLSDLAGEVWPMTPQKTQRKKQEAMPAIMPPVRARIDRRRGQLVASIDGWFLIDPTNGRRHDAKSFYRRFVEAQSKCIEQKAAPEGFEGKKVQDTRDTCITRLWEAGVPPGKMYAWTGHSQRSIERILRKHYIVLREAGSLAMAEQLTVWAVKEGFAL